MSQLIVKTYLLSRRHSIQGIRFLLQFANIVELAGNIMRSECPLLCPLLPLMAYQISEFQLRIRFPNLYIPCTTCDTWDSRNIAANICLNLTVPSLL